MEANKAVTLNLAERLTKQRNRLFHSGQRVDRGLLYGVLLPIVTVLATRSAELVALREKR